MVVWQGTWVWKGSRARTASTGKWVRRVLLGLPALLGRTASSATRASRAQLDALETLALVLSRSSSRVVVEGVGVEWFVQGRFGWEERAEEEVAGRAGGGQETPGRDGEGQ